MITIVTSVCVTDPPIHSYRTPSAPEATRCSIALSMVHPRAIPGRGRPDPPSASSRRRCSGPSNTSAGDGHESGPSTPACSLLAWGSSRPAAGATSRTMDDRVEEERTMTETATTLDVAHHHQTRPDCPTCVIDHRRASPERERHLGVRPVDHPPWTGNRRPGWVIISPICTVRDLTRSSPERRTPSPDPRR